MDTSCDLTINKFLNLDNQQLDQFDSFHNLHKYNGTNFDKMFKNLKVFVGFNGKIPSICSLEKVAGSILQGHGKLVKSKNGQQRTSNVFRNKIEKNMKLISNPFTRSYDRSFDFSLVQLYKYLSQVYGTNFYIAVDAVNIRISNRNSITTNLRKILQKVYQTELPANNILQKNVVNTIANLLDPSPTSSKKIHMYIHNFSGNRIQTRGMSTPYYQLHPPHVVLRSGTIQYTVSIKFNKNMSGSTHKDKPNFLIFENTDDFDHIKIEMTDIFTKKNEKIQQNTCTIYQYFNSKQTHKGMINIANGIYISKQNTKKNINNISHGYIDSEGIELHNFTGKGIGIYQIKKLFVELFSNVKTFRTRQKFSYSEQSLLNLIISIKRIGDGFQHVHSKILTDYTGTPYFVMSFDRLSSYIGIRRYQSHVIALVRKKFYIWVSKDSFRSRKRITPSQNASFYKKYSISSLLLKKNSALINALLQNSNPPNTLLKENRAVFNIIKDLLHNKQSQSSYNTAPMNTINSNNSITSTLTRHKRPRKI